MLKFFRVKYTCHVSNREYTVEIKDLKDFTAQGAVDKCRELNNGSTLTVTEVTLVSEIAFPASDWN